MKNSHTTTYNSIDRYEERIVKKKAIEKSIPIIGRKIEDQLITTLERYLNVEVRIQELL